MKKVNTRILLVFLLAIFLIPNLAFSSKDLTAEEKFQRVLLQQQKDKQNVLKNRFAAEELPFDLVGTYHMDRISNGVTDLAWDGSYLWGIDGLLTTTIYVVKIDPSNFGILDYFEAPNESWLVNGASGIACANGYLWVINYLDNKIYCVDPSTGNVNDSKTIDVSFTSNVIGVSGGCFDGKYLWFIGWGLQTKLYKVDLDKKEVVKEITLQNYEIAYDLTYIQGFLWVTATSSQGGYYFLKIDPSSGNILERYERNPCTYGITFTGKYLIIANWFNRKYYKYEVSSLSNNPLTAHDLNIEAFKDICVSITLDATNPDGKPLTYETVSLPSNGELSGVAPHLTYCPNPGYVGTDSFTYRASDGNSNSNIATVHITIGEVNFPSLSMRIFNLWCSGSNNYTFTSSFLFGCGSPVIFVEAIEGGRSPVDVYIKCTYPDGRSAYLAYDENGIAHFTENEVAARSSITFENQGDFMPVMVWWFDANNGAMLNDMPDGNYIWEVIAKNPGTGEIIQTDSADLYLDNPTK